MAETKEQTLYPYQLKIRSMILIDEKAKNILTPEEIQEIENMGLKFGPRPHPSPRILILVSPIKEAPNALIRSTELLEKGELDLVFFSREMVDCLITIGLDVLQDIKDEIANMEDAWKSSSFIKYYS